MLMQRPAEYEPPSGGSHTATITKITDLGIQKTHFGEKPQVRLRFDVEENDSHGAPKFVTKTFTNSLNEKSNFVKFFAEIGHPLSGGDVDTDSLLGIRFTIHLSQVMVDDKPRIRIEKVGKHAS